MPYWNFLWKLKFDSLPLLVQCAYLLLQILIDTAITTVLNRYLLTALGMNPDPIDAARKARHVVAALPKQWLTQVSGSMRGLYRVTHLVGNNLPLT